MIKQYKASGMSGGGKNKKYKYRDARVMTPGRVVLLAFLILLFMLLLGAYLFLTTDLFKPPPPTNIHFPGASIDGDFWIDADNAELHENLAGDWNPDCFTFLVVGTDAGVQTDTMMIVVFDTKKNKVSILNIPRDTYVETRSFAGKITNVYGRGRNIARENGFSNAEIAEEGLKYLKNMIQYTFGIPIQYHVLIDLRGFKFLVNEIGGVEFDVPMRMFYEDPAQNLYINLYPGVQMLNGDKAEQLVRFRSGYDGQDMDRIATQQRFLAALMKKLLKFDLKQINTLFETSSLYMETNISATDAVWFASRGMNVKLEDVRTNTVPGVWISPHQLAYKKETMEIINRHFNPFTRDIPESNFNINDKGMGVVSPTPIDIDGATMADMIK